MKTIKLITIIIAFSLDAAYAQQAIKQSSAITIKYHYQHKKLPDSISVWMYPKANYWDTSDDHYVVKNLDHSFVFGFSVKKSPLNYRLNVVVNGEPKQIGNYFALSGDQVKLDVFEDQQQDSLVFTGKGSAKYKLIDQLVRRESLILHTVQHPKKDISAEALDQDIQHFTGKMIKETAEKQRLIKNADPNIGDDLKQIIDYHYANYDITWINYLWRCRTIFKNSQQHQTVITKHFNTYYDQFLNKSTEISILSSRHYQYLVVMLWSGLVFNNINGNVDLKTLYDRVKQYSDNTKIKDRLLSEFFLTGGGGSTNYNDQVFDSLIRDASPYMISPLGKEFVENSLSFKKGSKFFDGEFIDLKGAKFSTADLRGKVFLLDAWGEGCGACVLFHEWFETNLWPKLKDNKDFVVLSVFDGKTKKDWERLRASDRYTSEHYLNVSNMPFRMAEHPLFKHYKVNYAPFLLLVDKKGNIIRKLNGNTSKENLMSLIEEYSNQ